MHKIDNINSILDAVNEINYKKKDKTLNISSPENFIPKLNQNLIIAPDIDKIISEAETYIKKSPLKSQQEVSEKNQIDTFKIKNYNKTFEEIQAQIIKDLYLKFTKKVKRNTLKVIFDLHLKIKDLEKQLENFQIRNEQSLNENNLSLKSETVESSKMPDPSINYLNKVLSKNKNFLKDEVVTSLKIQDSKISILNKKIKNFKKTEDKFLLQIISLEQDKTLLIKKTEKLDHLKDYKNFIDDIKVNLKSIYSNVVAQKQIFFDLNKNSIKTERDLSFYKENYEKKLIENNDLKTRLINAKRKIFDHEDDKVDLVSAFNNLNNILTKTKVAGNISPINESSEKKDHNKSKKIENVE